MTRVRKSPYPRLSSPLLPVIVSGIAIHLASGIPYPIARAQSDPIDTVLISPGASARTLSGHPLTLRVPGPELILFPRSVFTMGSSRQEVQLALQICQREPLGNECRAEMFENELAAHRVVLSPFWLDRTEVTVQAYQRCVDAGVCSPPPYSRGAQRFDALSLPVSLVSWEDARTFCHFVGKQLPTEAQWERAARGLSARRFPWGQHIATRRANHGTWAADNTDASDGFAELAPVGSFPQGRTTEQVDDLAGNVAEWVSDVYEDGYTNKPVVDPTGPAHGTVRVVRGGSYTHGMPWLRGAARMYHQASFRAPYLGFRCARRAAPSHPAP